tara:strand:+ start:4215 stop:4589 length:375 start_codon:yes stop_codon:yes gene_type:complete
MADKQSTGENISNTILKEIINPENVTSLINEFKTTLQKIKNETQEQLQQSEIVKNVENDDDDDYYSDESTYTEDERLSTNEVLLNNYFINDKKKNICEVLTDINNNLNQININMCQFMQILEKK